MPVGGLLIRPPFTGGIIKRNYQLSSFTSELAIIFGLLEQLNYLVSAAILATNFRKFHTTHAEIYTTLT